MKKYLFLVSVAALTFSSCSDQSTEFVGDKVAQQAREISFSPVARPTTRAAGAAEYNAVEGTAYPQNYDMKVVAYSVSATGAGNYFGSTTANAAPLFKYNYAGGATGGSNGYWGGVPPQYWPLAPATLNFLAVTNNGSPTADVVSETFNTDYASGVTVTLGDNKPQAATTGTGQHDLMYAFGREEVTQPTGNTLVFPDKVDMTFNHALAWVYFRVKAKTATETTITVNSIKLNGAYYGGTFTAALTNYDKAAATPGGALAWGTCQWATPTNTSDNVSSPNWTAAPLTTAFVGVGDGLLIVPQGSMATPAVSFTDFTIEYVLNGNTYQYTYAPTAAERTLLMGKKYIFDITFQLHEIFVNASVDDWAAPETAPNPITIQ